MSDTTSMVIETIHIQIWDIRVDERYYSFSYLVKYQSSGEEIISSYEDSHEWSNPQAWKQELERGEALKLVYQKLGEE